jgi:hypothetical protein
MQDSHEIIIALWKFLHRACIMYPELQALAGRTDEARNWVRARSFFRNDQPHDPGLSSVRLSPIEAEVVEKFYNWGFIHGALKHIYIVPSDYLKAGLPHSDYILDNPDLVKLLDSCYVFGHEQGSSLRSPYYHGK